MDPDEDRNLSSDEIKISKTEEVDDGITYEPTPYDMLGYRMGSPPPEWTKDELKGTNQQTTSSEVARADNTSDTNPTDLNSK